MPPRFRQLKFPFMRDVESKYKREKRQQVLRLLHVGEPRFIFDTDATTKRPRTFVEPRTEFETNAPRMREISRPFTAYHASVSIGDLNPSKQIHPGFHAGTIRAAVERVAGSIPKSYDVYRLKLDPKRTLGTFKSPLRDTENIGPSLDVPGGAGHLAKFFDAAIYKNEHEHKGSHSIVIINPNIIQSIRRSRRVLRRKRDED